MKRLLFVLFLASALFSSCSPNEYISGDAMNENYREACIQNDSNDILGSESNDDNDFEGNSDEVDESNSGGESQPIYESEHGRIFDFIELICRQTSEIVQIREGDIFDGFLITELHRGEVYDEHLDEWRTGIGVTYEKEVTFTGTLIRNEDFGFPWSVYLVISENYMHHLPQDIYQVMTETQGIFMVTNPATRDAIIAELGEEFERETVVTISHVSLMRTSYTSMHSIEITHFEALDNTDD